MRNHTLIVRAWIALLLAGACAPVLAQSIALTPGTPANESFDSLAASGTATTLPNGWYLLETGSNADGRYAADTGAANAGNTYSYGASGSAERALGMLRSGSLTPTIGARLRNDSAQTIDTIVVAYVGEQWRLGTAGRPDRLAFEYSLDASGLGNGSWTPVGELDFVAPVTGGAIGARDGNLAANRSAVEAAIEGLSLAPGAELWVRWVDADASGADDGLAIDEVRFTANGGTSPPLPPSVVSTVPADGAANVPAASDIRVVFSQSVTTDAGAFALACAGQPIALAETGSGSTRTLTPANVLPAGGSCQFAIDDDAVRNGAGLPLAAPVSVAFTVADGSLAGYYAQVNASSPGQLRCTLHATIRGHTAYPYSGSGTSTWTILELAQAHPTDPNRILDVYRNRLYVRGSDRAGTGSGLTYNREHTWPNSLGFPSTTGDLGLPNAPYTDTHMLYLSDTQWNADRGNKPYAYCPASASCGERVTEANFGVGGGSGVYPGNSNWVNGNSFEAWNFRKGDLARAVLYMAIRYEGGTDPASGQREPDLELTDDRSRIVGTSNYDVPAYMGLLADLLAWHVADPPDAAEIARNDVIQTFQGNRNPFIDHPEWATRALFESVTPAVCEPASNDAVFVDGFDGTP